MNKEITQNFNFLYFKKDLAECAAQADQHITQDNEELDKQLTICFPVEKLCTGHGAKSVVHVIIENFKQRLLQKALSL